MLALSDGHDRLTGVPRMHERPIGDLVEALRPVGARIEYLGKPGFPPLAIGPGPAADATVPARVAVRGDVSSQYLSALLMALPLLTGSVLVDPAGCECEESSHEEHSPPMQTPRHESLGEKQGSPLQRGQNIDTFLHCETPAATVYRHDPGWRCPLSQATA